MRWIPWVVAGAILGGCTAPTPVADADRTRAERFVAAEQSPLPVKHLAMWYSEGEPPQMVCGEIEAPPALKAHRDRLRYVVFLGTPKPEGAIEMHELVVAGGALGEQMIAESRRIFDKTWEVACAANAPRSIGRWFRGTETAGDGGSDTPIANAEIGDLLGNRR